jgi:hypothetical protein
VEEYAAEHYHHCRYVIHFMNNFLQENNEIREYLHAGNQDDCRGPESVFP